MTIRIPGQGNADFDRRKKAHNSVKTPDGTGRRCRPPANTDERSKRRAEADCGQIMPDEKETWRLPRMADNPRQDARPQK
ncbi:MAG: hypothetical protein LBG29_09320 [Synergistaceae bacterium]|nr:hypothetical protein [Synergistaceae bacterium]